MASPSSAPSFTTTGLCCTHPQSRLNSPSPVPPRHAFPTHLWSRPSADESIFATASLPEDHPHAPHFPDRRVRPTSAVMDIVRSPPNLKERMLDRLRRSSVRNLWLVGRDAVDATILSSEAFENFDSDDSKRGSTTIQDTDVARIAEGVALRWPISYLDDHGNDRVLGKAVSSPDLLERFLGRSSAVRRTRSAAVGGEGLEVPRVGAHESSEFPQSTEMELNTWEERASAERFQDMEQCSSHGPLPNQTRLSSESSGMHLQMMDISEQLRSLSQLSDLVSEEYDMMTAPEPWTFHNRKISQAAVPTTSSQQRAHSRSPSSGGLREFQFPHTTMRARSPDGDATSSIYSRPYSPDTTIPGNCAETFPLVIQHNLDVAADNWPLPNAHHCPTNVQHSNDSTNSGSSIIRINDKHTRVAEAEAERFTRSKTPIDDDPCVGLAAHSPSKRDSVIGKGSSSTLNSKRSRFFERFSPPKKTIAKRRSIFKFLRPSSRRQSRIVSSPTFQCSPPDYPDAYDGSPNDQGLLTVQYELTDYSRPSQNVSSERPEPNEAHLVDHLMAPVSTKAASRQPSLADYELSLTAGSDNRRKPSSVDLQKLQDIRDEERRESLSVRRERKRAAALDEQDSSPLMAQALRKHQAEKMLFCSESKRRESLATPASFLFRPRTSEAAGGSLAPPSILESNESLDPHDESTVANRGRIIKGHGVETLTESLYPQDNQSNKILKHRSVSEISPLMLSSASTKESIPETTKPPKIGTSLKSWCRFPSHTRRDRCSSAGRADTVTARDFATVSQMSGSVPTTVDPSKNNTSTQVEDTHARKDFIRRRSTNFGTVLRYYQNLFTNSTFKGQNRRTSISVGGKLRNPDLEMLPPSTADTSGQNHSKHVHEHLKEVERRLADGTDESPYYNERSPGGKGKMPESRGLFRSPFHPAQASLPVPKSPVSERRDSAIGPTDASPVPDLHPVPPDPRPITPRPVSVPTTDPTASSSLPAPSSPASAEAEELAPMADASAPTSRESPDAALILDGPANLTIPPRSPTAPRLSPSKAELWSAEYQSCLSSSPTRPPRPHDPPPPPSFTSRTGNPLPASRAPPRVPAYVPPEAPHPSSPRSHGVREMHPPIPLRSHSLSVPPSPFGSSASSGVPVRIRRFPSVTVVDDRRGHARSVSLISNATGRTASWGSGGLSQRGDREDGKLERGGEGGREGGGDKEWVGREGGGGGGKEWGMGKFWAREDGVERESTRDLLLLLQRREREERERLIGLR